MIDFAQTRKVGTEIFDAAMDWIFPCACPVCGELVAHSARYSAGKLANITHNCYNETEFGICEKCTGKLSAIAGKSCIKCGKPLNCSEFCESCENKIFYIDRNIPVFVYDEIIRKSIHGFKYSFNPQSAAAFGRIMGIKLLSITQENELCGFFLRHKKEFVVIPVPLHRTRLKNRGYNQAQILAKEVSRALNIQMLENCVSRTKETIPQSEILLKKDREENVRNAFSVLDSESIKGKYVLIVDDIYTTGSTLNELAKTIGVISGKRVFSATLSISVGEKNN